MNRQGGKLLRLLSKNSASEESRTQSGGLVVNKLIRILTFEQTNQSVKKQQETWKNITMKMDRHRPTALVP